jgi:hypothetical protein
MVECLRGGTLTPPPHGVLVQDLTAVIRDGSSAAVAAPHLRLRSRHPLTARAVLRHLLEQIVERVPERERLYLPTLSDRVTFGSLSERIASRVRLRAPRSGARQRAVIREIYEELAECLRTNTPWPG